MKVVIFHEGSIQKLEQRINEYIGNKKVVSISTTFSADFDCVATLLIDTSSN